MILYKTPQGALEEDQVYAQRNWQFYDDHPNDVPHSVLKELQNQLEEQRVEPVFFLEEESFIAPELEVIPEDGVLPDELVLPDGRVEQDDNAAPSDDDHSDEENIDPQHDNFEPSPRQLRDLEYAHDNSGQSCNEFKKLFDVCVPHSPNL